MQSRVHPCVYHPNTPSGKCAKNRDLYYWKKQGTEQSLDNCVSLASVQATEWCRYHLRLILSFPCSLQPICVTYSRGHRRPQSRPFRPSFLSFLGTFGHERLLKLFGNSILGINETNAVSQLLSASLHCNSLRAMMQFPFSRRHYLYIGQRHYWHPLTW